LDSVRPMTPSIERWPSDAAAIVTLYGLTLLAVRLLLAALDTYAQHEHLYTQDQAGDDVQTECRELWPVIAAPDVTDGGASAMGHGAAR
jgi:hypothetical protein